VVTPITTRDVFVLGRSRDDDFLAPPLSIVGAGFGGVGEEAGRFHDNVNADIAQAGWPGRVL
jgi:hypothetical protein